jgi:S1-C subfamily serine protease
MIRINLIRPSRVAAVVALVAIGGCTSAHAQRVDPTKSVVVIQATGCRPFPNRAVGMVVGDGLVATVAHAVAGESDIGVVAPDGRTLHGKVAAIDTAIDAAVLRVGGLDLPPLPRRTYKDGEPVRLVRAANGDTSSTPITIQRRVTVRTTDIYRQGDHLRPGFEIGADVKAGDSGGGLVGADGSLLGLVWATSREVDDQAWALPVEAIDPLMNAVNAGKTPSTAACSR